MAAPEGATIVVVRLTYILAKDPYPKAKQFGKRIEDRIVGEIKQSFLH